LRRAFKGHTEQVNAIAFSPDGCMFATGGGDAFVYLWDMTRPFANNLANSMSSTDRIATLFDDLSKNDATAAYDAILYLSKSPDKCIEFLGRRLQPIRSPTDAQIAQWIAELDDDSFNQRREASRQLSDALDAARPALKKALDGNISQEAKGRIESILESTNYSPDALRQIRCVELLGLIRNEKAVQLLKRLASGSADAQLTREARSTLARFNQRR
jgi:WD domain, G-beta repeat